MIGLLIATRMEAEPLLLALRERYRETADRSQPFARFALDHSAVAVAISGMGGAAAFRATRTLLGRCQPAEIINLGIAGALGPGFEIGNIYRITQAVGWPKGADAPWPLAPGRFTALPPARLVTASEPVFSGEARARLSPMGDLVDMEGAAVAAASAGAGVPLTAIKCVSDRADDRGRETLRENLEAMARRMAELVFPMLTSTEGEPRGAH